MKLTSLLVTGAVLALAALPAASQLPVDEPEPLPLAPAPLAAISGRMFSPAEPSESRAIPTDGDFLRSRPVRLDAALLDNLRRRGWEVGSRYTFDFFDDVHLTIEVREHQENSRRGFSVFGSIEGDPLGTFALSARRGLVFGNFRTGRGELYTVRYLAEALHFVAQVSTQPTERCLNGPEQRYVPAPGELEEARRRRRQGPEELLQTKADSVFDVLVVYTDSAAGAAGGSNPMLLSIETMIAEGNQAFFDSDVSADFRLVGAVRTPYSEASASLTTHLKRLTDAADGSIDEVHDWRNACGADLTIMIVNDTDGIGAAGVAWVMPAFPFPWTPPFNGPFGIAHWSAAAGNFTLIHELAHNMGCDHDWNNGGGGGSFSYANGHQFAGVFGGPWRTIMAYAPGTRIGRYSNPLKVFDDTPTGVKIGEVNEADNESAIDNNRVWISNFTSTVTPLSTVYVDFDSGGGLLENGSSAFPYDDFIEAYLRAADNADIICRGGTTKESLYLFKDLDVRTEAGSGVTTLGD